MRFRDRREAGHRLGARLGHLVGQRPLVVALPRGGVPVAYEVARALGAPLDVIVVRKLGCPWQPELGLGAIGEGGIRLLNDHLMRSVGVAEADLDEVTRREQAELEQRIRRYRGDRGAIDPAGRTVVVVDDGLATGFTALAAIEVLRRRGARRIVLAVPVAPADTVARLRRVADEVVCLHAPRSFMAIGQFYADFAQTPDHEVARLLAAQRPTHPREPHAPSDPALAIDVAVEVDGATLPGTLRVPSGAAGLVLFAHGSGSSRNSPRNQAVGRYLNDGGLATLLFDLLTPAEAERRSRVFDVGLLGTRLVEATGAITARPEVASLPVGYVGASTGAAAALWAAAELGDTVGAVVSRGGRPDLAASRLAEVTAPTMLIVGGRDEVVLELNEEARRRMRCPTEFAVIPGATHLFEEPGAMERVAALARGWLTDHLGARRAVRDGADSLQ